MTLGIEPKAFSHANKYLTTELHPPEKQAPDFWVFAQNLPVEHLYFENLKPETFWPSCWYFEYQGRPLAFDTTYTYLTSPILT